MPSITTRSPKDTTTYMIRLHYLSIRVQCSYTFRLCPDITVQFLGIIKDVNNIRELWAQIFFMNFISNTRQETSALHIVHQE